MSICGVHVNYFKAEDIAKSYSYDTDDPWLNKGDPKIQLEIHMVRCDVYMSSYLRLLDYCCQIVVMNWGNVESFSAAIGKVRYLETNSHFVLNFRLLTCLSSMLVFS